MMVLALIAALVALAAVGSYLTIHLVRREADFHARSSEENQ